MHITISSLLEDDFSSSINTHEPFNQKVMKIKPFYRKVEKGKSYFTEFALLTIFIGYKTVKESEFAHGSRKRAIREVFDNVKAPVVSLPINCINPKTLFFETSRAS